MPTPLSPPLHPLTVGLRDAAVERGGCAEPAALGARGVVERLQAVEVRVRVRDQGQGKGEGSGVGVGLGCGLGLGLGRRSRLQAVRVKGRGRVRVRGRARPYLQTVEVAHPQALQRGQAGVGVGVAVRLARLPPLPQLAWVGDGG